MSLVRCRNVLQIFKNGFVLRYSDFAFSTQTQIHKLRRNYIDKSTRYRSFHDYNCVTVSRFSMNDYTYRFCLNILHLYNQWGLGYFTAKNVKGFAFCLCSMTALIFAPKSELTRTIVYSQFRLQTDSR